LVLIAASLMRIPFEFAWRPMIFIAWVVRWAQPASRTLSCNRTIQTFAVFVECIGLNLEKRENVVVLILAHANGSNRYAREELPKHRLAIG
jgi:hypothetical protein